MIGVLRTRIIIDEGLWHLKNWKLSLTSLKKYHACPQFHSGWRAETKEARGETGDDPTQCTAQICHEEKSEKSAWTDLGLFKSSLPGNKQGFMI